MIVRGTLLLMLSLLALGAAAQSVSPTPTPTPLPSPDACGAYGGNNSTCHCDSTKKKAWITFGLVLFLTPVAAFAVMRWFVFTDVTMPHFGIYHSMLMGSYDRDAAALLFWEAFFWTALVSVCAWTVITIRYVLDLWSNKIQLCANLNRFVWHCSFFWIIPLAVATFAAIIRLTMAASTRV